MIRSFVKVKLKGAKFVNAVSKVRTSAFEFVAGGLVAVPTVLRLVRDSTDRDQAVLRLFAAHLVFGID